MTKPTNVLIDRHPGRSTQTIGLARALGTDPDLIHEPSVGVVGTKGDSQCYIGVMSKVEAIHERLKARIGTDQGQLKMRLVQPEYTIATSDGIRNGTREMRYSLIGREVTTRQALERATSELRQVQAQIAVQQEKLADFVILSPMDGVVLRRDGFVSVRAGAEPGNFTTPPLAFTGRRLLLNVTPQLRGASRRPR